MIESIQNLAPRTSKSELCALFGVARMRNLRDQLFTDEFITIRLELSIPAFNRRQQFSVLESITIKKHLLELYEDERPEAATQ